MSEYQYYEFAAVDTPLDAAAMSAVRALSTRATITPTSFVNEYHWGDFRGDPAQLVARYYDAFLYLANWGTRRLMLRVPSTVLSLVDARAYCYTEGAVARRSGRNVVLDLCLDAEPGDDEFYDEDELYDDALDGEGRLDALLPLRAEIAEGDLRPLYLAWLHAVTAAEVDDEDVEPPLPSGLDDLTDAQEALVQFLHIDEHLLAVAAADSPSGAGSGDVEWPALVARLPQAQKDAWLVRLAEGAPHLGAQLRRRLLADGSADVLLPGRFVGDPDEPRRTVGQLLGAAAEQQEAHEEAERRRAAAEHEAQVQAAARARREHLDDLARQGEEPWRQVDALIGVGKPAEYDRVVTLLVALVELAERDGDPAEARGRVITLRERFANRPALLRRLDAADLPA